MSSEQHKGYYEVRYGDLINIDLSPTGHMMGNPTSSCGHRHRTYDAALRCQDTYYGVEGQPFHLGVYFRAEGVCRQIDGPEEAE